MKKLFTLLTGITLVATSCTKEKSNDPDSSSSGSSFLPAKKDTYLKMKVIMSGYPDRISTLVSTGQKTTLDGVDFTTWKEQESGQEQQFGYKDHDIYTRIKAVSPNTGALVDVNFIYLNDTASVGYKWTRAAGFGGSFSAKMPGEIIEKNITKDVQGKTYKDVTHTRVDLTYVIPGYGDLTLAEYDFYIAKNIGVIKIDSKTFDEYGDVDVTAVSDLIEYSIK